MSRPANPQARLSALRVIAGLLSAALLFTSPGVRESSVKTVLRTLPQPVEDSLATERRAFERQRAQLMRRYPGQFVALSGGRVVDHDKEDETLAARMFRKLGDAPFYIARLEDNPTVYEVPSPELMG